MRFCRPHWDKLRDKIKAEGLYHLVPRGGEAASKNLAAELDHGPSKETFDPLMAAHNAIFAHSLEVCGLEIMSGDTCPVCWPQQHCPCKEADCVERVERWIDFAVRDAKEEALRLGLKPLSTT